MPGAKEGGKNCFKMHSTAAFRVKTEVFFFGSCYPVDGSNSIQLFEQILCRIMRKSS